LNGQVVDDGLDTRDLGGVGGGEGAGGFAAYGSVEGGDLFLDGGLDGFAAKGAVAGYTALKRGGQAGVVGGSGSWSSFAAGEAQGNGEGGGGHDGARDGEIFTGVHRLPFFFRRRRLLLRTL
jgi:hypothetical protein